MEPSELKEEFDRVGEEEEEKERKKERKKGKTIGVHQRTSEIPPDFTCSSSASVTGLTNQGLNPSVLYLGYSVLCTVLRVL